jgi:hypothetical protein
MVSRLRLSEAKSPVATESVGQADSKSKALNRSVSLAALAALVCQTLSAADAVYHTARERW